MSAINPISKRKIQSPYYFWELAIFRFWSSVRTQTIYQQQSAHLHRMHHENQISADELLKLSWINISNYIKDIDIQIDAVKCALNTKWSSLRTFIFQILVLLSSSLALEKHLFICRMCCTTRFLMFFNCVFFFTLYDTVETINFLNIRCAVWLSMATRNHTNSIEMSSSLFPD